MSKKLAEGIDALVLDVKCGRGAFMTREADARRLAETLVGIGGGYGKRTVAWLTRMDAPLGEAVGNWPEVVEAVQCLRGEGDEALMTLTFTLAGEMLWLGGAARSPAEGQTLARQAIESGAALDRFIRLVEAQGGDASVLREPKYRFGDVPAFVLEAPAGWDGYVGEIDARAVGWAAVDAGAGRNRKEDPVDPAAGLVIHAQPGARVSSGLPLCTVYSRRTSEREAIRSRLLGAFSLRPEPPSPRPILLARFAEGAWQTPNA
jgi:pyrimidine-nucleoside phosphorylase